ncbi:sugar ABC transporter permease [Paenibacillus antri]|uniref:Sugar ABC transporter permease n=1 Tax=Paenibacillus antri TaxID=2582848 RepID=A0A5R9GCR0_9BACL|nr:sugar ABC transporter permease [Paenibacillus antri]TLS51870.1 sugar ABC transporter permease [Paenibacillus antri]
MKRLSAKAVRNIEGSLFIAPWVVGFFVFMAFPIFYSLYMSFHRVQVLATGIEANFVGFDLYKSILFENGSVLYNDLIPFLSEAVIMLPIIIIFSLLIAIILNQRFPGRLAFRMIFFLPVIFTTGRVILEFIAQGEGGLDFLSRYNVNSFIATRLPELWANAIITVLESFILILWYSGVQILLFLAGRQTIPSSIYEASRIDGANPWETFWKITLPGMIPFIFLNLIYTVVDLFTFPTNPIIAKVNSSNYGLSSALAWIYFMIILAFLGVTLLVFHRITRSYRVVNS